MHLLWLPQLNRKLAESERLDANPPRAARAYAAVAVAGHDAAVACWDCKYHYWTGRPIHFDPGLTPLVTTPPHPDYPSAHSTVDAATGEVLATLFPRDAAFFRSRADEDAATRSWAGIHFRSACEAGLTLGRGVAERVAARLPRRRRGLTKPGQRANERPRGRAFATQPRPRFIPGSNSAGFQMCGGDGPVTYVVTVHVNGVIVFHRMVSSE